MTKAYSGTQAVRRAVALLERFSDERPSWTVTDLAEAVNLNRTTTYRLLTALASADLVTRDVAGDSYRLGSNLIALGGRAQRANRLRPLVQSELVHLVETTGETATLEILTGWEMLIVEEVVSDRLLSCSQSIGTRWPVYATSTGLALLAHLPEEQVKEVLAGSLRAITTKTETDAGRIRQKLAQVQQQGYAVLAEALELGYVAIAAPIFNHEGQPIATLSVGGPLVRLTTEMIEEIGRLLHEAAGRVSYQLGFRETEKLETRDRLVPSL
jgi:DNA-binding IclR family transcriptional regulator